MYSSWPLLSGISLKGATSSSDAASVLGGGDLLRAFFEDCAGESLVGKDAGKVVLWWVSALSALVSFIGSFRFTAIAGRTVLGGETFGRGNQDNSFSFWCLVQGGVLMRISRLRCENRYNGDVLARLCVVVMIAMFYSALHNSTVFVSLYSFKILRVIVRGGMI